MQNQNIWRILLDDVILEALFIINFESFSFWLNDGDSINDEDSINDGDSILEKLSAAVKGFNTLFKINDVMICELAIIESRDVFRTQLNI